MSNREILVNINKALFKKAQSSHNQTSFIFPNAIEHFTLTTPAAGSGFWGIIGPRKSDFLHILAANYISVPSTAREYSRLISSKPGSIAYLDFRERSGLDKVHLAARYESYSFKGKLEMSDDVNSVQNYITGANNYNSNSPVSRDEEYEYDLTRLLGLERLLGKWVNSLSNGQMRRARIAKALYRKPSMLIIDDPFLGLDPKATTSVAGSLQRVATDLDFGLVLGLRIQDDIPNWITHLAYVNDSGIVSSGEKKDVLGYIKENSLRHTRDDIQRSKTQQYAQVGQPKVYNAKIEFMNASVSYKGLPILQNISWGIEKGSKWRIIGDNGSGKTTLVSLITADHPQSWRSVIKIDGVLRKPGSGVNYFGINDQIGLSSPELHANVPSQMSMEDIVLNGLVSGIGNSNFAFRFKGNALTEYAETLFEHFQTELQKNSQKKFYELSTSLQKLTLFLRAVVKNPSILILDEAFSCMDDEALVFKCHDFIAKKLHNTTVLSIGHIDWEVPQHDYAIKLVGDSKKSVEYLKPWSSE